jgi:hypothetical protein
MTNDEVEEAEIRWRFDAGPRGGYSVFGYKVLRKTPCGVIVDVFGTEKFCNDKTRKRFGYPTKEEAFESFIRRKKKQLKILAGQHDAVKDLVELAEKEGCKDVVNMVFEQTLFG